MDSPENVIQVVLPLPDHTHLCDEIYRLSTALGKKFPDNYTESLFGGEYGYGMDFKNEVFSMYPDYQDASCNCGHAEEADKWFAANPHKDNCYSVVVRLKEAQNPYKEAREAALSFRNKWPIFSEESMAAQKELERICDLRDEWEDAMHRALCRDFEIPWNNGWGCACHCTCGVEELVKAYLSEHDHTTDCPIGRPNFWHFASNLRITWYKYIGRNMKAEPVVPDEQIAAIVDECIASLEPRRVYFYQQLEESTGQKFQQPKGKDWNKE